MQPTAKPRLDCLENLGQRILGIALSVGLERLVFLNVNGGQDFSFRAPRRKFSLGGSYRLVGSG
jgi:hypothetical protein